MKSLKNLEKVQVLTNEQKKVIHGGGWYTYINSSTGNSFQVFCQYQNSGSPCGNKTCMYPIGACEISGVDPRVALRGQ